MASLIHGLHSPSVTIKILEVEYKFRLIKSGSFMMGSSHEEQEISSDIAWEFDRNIDFGDERQHEVTIKNDYFMLETPITHAMWRTVILDRRLAELMGCDGDLYKGLYKTLVPVNYFDREHAKRLENIKNVPVTYVSWSDCQIFINKVNKILQSKEFEIVEINGFAFDKFESAEITRQESQSSVVPNSIKFEELLKNGFVFKLPTEAQWEYACKAEICDNKPYSYGFVNKSLDGNSDDVQENQINIKILEQKIPEIIKELKTNDNDGKEVDKDKLEIIDKYLKREVNKLKGKVNKIKSDDSKANKQKTKNNVSIKEVNEKIIKYEILIETIERELIERKLHSERQQILNKRKELGFKIDHGIINYHMRYPNTGEINKQTRKFDVKIRGIEKTTICNGKTVELAERRNPWGVIDMHGNVAEWCNDWYGPYSLNQCDDPEGPKNGTRRVIRGGGWSDPAYLCRSSCRYLDFPDVRHSHVGFRPVLCKEGSETREADEFIALLKMIYNDYSQETKISSDYRLVRLDKSYVVDAIKMRDEIIEENKERGAGGDYIIDETDEEFNAFFTSPDSYALGVLTSSEELVAVGIGSYRKNAIDAALKKLPESSVRPDRRQVGYIELIQVKKEHRGHGFQQLFFNELEARFRANSFHKATHLMGIVSPTNEISLANYEKCGYQKASSEFDHPQGYKRLVMVKTLEPAP